MAWMAYPDFQCIQSYEEANERLKEAKPYPETNKNDPHSRYRLEQTRKRHVNIRLMSPRDVEDMYSNISGDNRALYSDAKDMRHIALQFYRTDCSIYREDGNWIVTPYVSASTNNYMNNATPARLDTHYSRTHRLACCLSCTDVTGETWYWSSSNTRFYELGSVAMFTQAKAPGPRLEDGRAAWAEGDWYPVAGHEPFNVPVLDRKKSREAYLKHNVTDFARWVQVYVRMKAIRYEAHSRRSFMTRTEIIKALEQRDFERLALCEAWWPDGRTFQQGFVRVYPHEVQAFLAAKPHYFHDKHVRSVINEVRKAVLATENCVSFEPQDFVLGARDGLQKYDGLVARYDWG